MTRYDKVRSMLHMRAFSLRVTWQRSPSTSAPELLWLDGPCLHQDEDHPFAEDSLLSGGDAAGCITASQGGIQPDGERMIPVRHQTVLVVTEMKTGSSSPCSF